MIFYSDQGAQRLFPAPAHLSGRQAGNDLGRPATLRWLSKKQPTAWALWSWPCGPAGATCGSGRVALWRHGPYLGAIHPDRGCSLFSRARRH
jgi:hypothetical protein